MIVALYFLALASLLLFINIRTYRSQVAKRTTYLGMWASIAVSVVLVLLSLP